MADFLMPSLGADMESGTLVAWRVKPGDVVARGQIVAEVETQKGIIEVESFHAGRVQELLVTEGTTVPVGTLLARIGDEAPAAAEAAGVTPAGPAAASPERASPAAHRASPAARKRARELGVTLASVVGTGPQGAITLADVESAAARATGGAPAAAAQPAPAAGRADGMRRAIAAAMSRANAEIPHYYLATDVDMSGATDFLARENAARPPESRLVLASLLVKAVAEAGAEVPAILGWWIDGSFRPAPAAHVGFAISLRGGGLVNPAIRDAGTKDLERVNAELLDLIARARRGGLRASEMSEQAITVTSLGERGVEAVWGVIHPPQVALIGFGKVTMRPAVAGDAIVARPLMTATLAGDHRVSDGHEGAAALAAIKRRLEAWR